MGRGRGAARGGGGAARVTAPKTLPLLYPHHSAILIGSNT